MAEIALNDGDVLTGADCDLIDQQLCIICTSGTRPSATEGRHIYETDTNRQLFYDGSAWVILHEPFQSWTPTVVQSVTVTGTVNRGWYQRANGLFRAHVTFTASSAGTAANGIVLTTPVTLANSEDVGGSLTTDTVRHAGIAPFSTTTVRFFCEAASSVLGVNPAYTIASGHVIRCDMTGRYA